MKRLPNLITSVRIALTICLNIYIYLNFGEMILPLILTVIIFSSDMLDGWLARKLNAVTKFGVAFDAFADIFYVTLSYLVLCRYGILPVMGIVLILFKFLEFIVTSAILQTHRESPEILIFDRIGKTVGIIFYMMPMTTYMFHQTFSEYNRAIHMTIGFTVGILGVMVVLSSWGRIRRCMKAMSQSIASQRQ
jgi:phosphatidylglycerophosphate synthase